MTSEEIHATARTAVAAFICPLRPLVQALEVVGIAAKGDVVLIEADGPNMRLTGNDGTNVVSTVVPAQRAFRDMIISYDELLDVLRVVASERHDCPTDERLVKIYETESFQPVVEVDGLSVYRILRAEQGILCGPEKPGELVVVGRDDFVAAIPPWFAEAPVPRSWTNHLTLDVTSGEVVIRARGRLSTTVTSMEAKTADAAPSEDKFNLSPQLLARVAPSLRADTVRIGWRRSDHDRLLVSLCCGDLTILTSSLKSDGGVREEARWLTGRPLTIIREVNRSLLLSAIEQCIKVATAAHEPTPNVILKPDAKLLTVIPFFGTGHRHDQKTVIGARVDNHEDTATVCLNAGGLRQALERLDATYIQLELWEKGAAVVISADPDAPFATRRRQTTHRRHVLLLEPPF